MQFTCKIWITLLSPKQHMVLYQGISSTLPDEVIVDSIHIIALKIYENFLFYKKCKIAVAIQGK